MRVSSILVLLLVPLASAQRLRGGDGPPLVADGFVVDVVAKEPIVRNPCVMAFDRHGRLCVAQGPQWRKPTPETPGDRVDILIDDDGDGVVDRSTTFAKGFNSVQGLAWHGDDLWVANAPDLTVVRDTDGDDQADDYVRVYTGLGNLEHSLHGLSFGPDGKLYMSKGNSKGYNRLDQLAPKVFRELWGLSSPQGAPEYTPIESFTRNNYQRNYHTFHDDWGQQGGILRCDPYDAGEISGRNLEIVARGMRNPWDLAIDDQFNWLANDNDQTGGDRLLSPFVGAHFGWGHRWSFSWTGENHLPTVPVSAPLFEGSGTGLVHYHANHFPADYRGAFFAADWLKRQVVAYRPRFDGALLLAEPMATPIAAAGSGRTLPESEGRAFDPTDIEVGPDGALYVLSWGHGYGATLEKGEQQDIGRVYRIRSADNELQQFKAAHRDVPIERWSLDQVFEDLGSHIPACRVNAQQEFWRRGEAGTEFLMSRLGSGETTADSQQTWAIWTLSRMVDLPRLLQLRGNSNLEFQVHRAIADRIRNQSIPAPAEFVQNLRSRLRGREPRIRFEASQAIVQARLSVLSNDLIQAMTVEEDRIAFYAMWNGLRELMDETDRRQRLARSDGQCRLGLLLGLMADGDVSVDVVRPLTDASDRRTADLAQSWLQQTGADEPLVRISPPPGDFVDTVQIQLEPRDSGCVLAYTTDGSVPAATSRRYKKPIRLDESTTLKVAAIRDNRPVGQIVTASYRIVEDLDLMDSQSTPVTVADVMSEMASADQGLGRQLYMHPSGAGCVKCHPMNPAARLLGPDLSDIGRRAKSPRLVVESILHPSAIITEGFAQQKLLLVDGRVLTGAVIEETGSRLKIAGNDGTLRRVNKSDIEKRVGTLTSPMPNNFATMMSARQIASLTAWLMTLQADAAAGQKLAGQVHQESTDEPNGFSFRESNDQLQILYDGQRVATYLKSHPILTRWALVDVRTPQGTPVTRPFRPERIAPSENRQRQLTGTDHPAMHPGIWISFADLDGSDFWRLQAKAVFDGFVTRPTSGIDSLEFAVRSRMMRESGDDRICEEVTRWKIQRVPEGFLIRLSATYRSPNRSFYFGDQEESGLGVRVAPELRVRGGNGTIVNDRGEKNEPQVWGKHAKWFDYAGMVNGRYVGIMVMPSAGNPTPSWLHARNYGVVVTNPFPKQPRERREPFVKTHVQKGEPFKLEYDVLIHETNSREEFDAASRYERR